ncbi:MAG: DsbE family thiol:disulfide interchange protein [Gammaproteobacteria bacterium]|jgi:cytochrome c biogenesis protein CcmG/thiol:disulfide interchange protein DsbE
MSQETKTRSPLRRFMPLIIFAMLVAVLAIGLTLNPSLVPSPLVGKPAPAFELPLLNSAGMPKGPVELNTPGKLTQSDLKGDITLLNVFASWCFACRQEHQAITQLSNSGIRVIGFNYKDKPEDAMAWLRRFGNPYQIVAQDLDGRVGIDWGVYGAPETFVIDHNGIVRDKRIGPVDAEYIQEKLMPLLKQIRSEQA